MTFTDVVFYCYDQPEFLTQYDRLTGANLSRKGKPLDLAIDVGPGRRDAEMLAFVEFVREVVWDRLPPDAFRAVLPLEPPHRPQDRQGGRDA